MDEKKMVRLTVNGNEAVCDSPELPLLRFLRDRLGLVGVKEGCDQEQCGACTVLINDRAERACARCMGELDGARVETIEGLSNGGNLHPLQLAFAKLSAFQCGFCTPGMIMAAKALLDGNLNPTEAEIREALKNNLCRCTGYKKIVEAVLLAAKMLRGETQIELSGEDAGVGGRHIRSDAIAKVTGRAVFTDDYKLENPLFGKMLFSEFPHARILDIDSTEAEALPGVVRVALWKDVPGRKDFGQGMFPQQPVIAGDVVRFVGDPVAVVYAESPEQAAEALGHIRVTYEPLPVLTDPEEAMAEGAYPIHPEGNLLKHIHTHKGNVERGFSEADYIVEDDFSVQCVEHAYMEPDAALSEYDDQSRLTVYGSVQNPMGLRKDLAACLALDERQVRVVTRPNGGAFGGREEPSVHIQAALGTLLTGRPVRMVFTREELNRFSTKRHAMKMHYRLGAKKDGRLTAVAARTVGDTGAYASSGEFVLFRACVFGAGPYEVPNAWMDSYAVYTNNAVAASMRGFGSTQPCVPMETLLDRLAEKCGITPLEIRRINGLSTGKQTLTGQVIDYGVGFQATLEAVGRLVVAGKLPEPAPGKKIGVGYAGCMKNVGLGSGSEDAAWAQVRLTPEGKILLIAGGVECGQGHDTVIAQIAAQVLGISAEHIVVAPVDSDYSLDGGITTASRLTFVSGNAVKAVCASFKKRLLEYAGELLGVSPGRLDCCYGGIREIQREGTEISLAELAREAEEKGVALHDQFYYVAPRTSPIKECSDNISNEVEKFRLHFAYCYGTQAAVVQVDEQTGEVKVLRIYAAHDVGKAINPALVEGQIEGGVAMGIGYALSEEFVMENGYIVTKDLGSLGVPTALDVPGEIQTVLVEENHPYGPFGAKGMGELPLNATAPAILNAIYDAVGVRVTSLPVKPEKLRNILQAKKRSVCEGGAE